MTVERLGQQFGTHPEWTAYLGVSTFVLFFRVTCQGYSKVSYLYNSVVVQQIAGLDISMDNSFRMQILQSIQGLIHDTRYLFLAKGSLLNPHYVRQWPSLTILHNDPHFITKKLNSMTFDHIWMIAVIHDVNLCLDSIKLILIRLNGYNFGSIYLFCFFTDYFVYFSRGALPNKLYFKVLIVIVFHVWISNVLILKI